MANIQFTAILNTIPLDKGIQKATASVQLFSKRMNGLFSDLEQQSYRAMTRLTAYLSIFAAAGLVKQIVEVRGQFQQLQIAFETMLDSKEKADRIMQESISLAQRTPFTLMDVTTNAKQLMAMGVSFEKVMDTMRSLGDVSAGLSVPLQRLVINYGQVLTLGRLQQREVRDFAMAGVPLLDELAKNMGKTKEEITNLIHAGRIGFPEVEKAFQTMSGEGGKFYNLMEKQNKSVTGQISNLVDKWQVAMNEMGQSSEGFIYGSIRATSSLIENYKAIGNVLLDLVVAYGAYKGALMALSAMYSVHKNIEFGITASQYAPLLSAKQAQAIADAKLIAGTNAYNIAVVNAITTEKLHAIALADQAAAKSLSTQATLKNIRAEISDMVSGKASMDVKRLQALRTADKTLAVEAETLAAQANTAAQVRDNIVSKVDIADKKTQITLTKILTVAKTKLATVTKSLSVWAAANMWTLVAAGIAAAIYVTYKLVTADSALEKAEKKLNKTLEKNREEREKIVNGSSDLISAIRSETNTIYEQVSAYDELAKKSAFWSKFSFTEIRNMSTDDLRNKRQEYEIQEDLTQATKDYNNQLKIVSREKAHILAADVLGETVSEKKLNKEIFLLDRYKDILESIRKREKEATFLGLDPEVRKERLEDSRRTLISDINKYSQLDTYDPIKIEKLSKILAETDDMLKEFYTGEENRNYAYWEKIKQNAEAGKKSLPASEKNSQAWRDYTAEIEKAKKMMALYDDEIKKSSDNSEKLFEQRNKNELYLNQILQENLLKSEDEGLQTRIRLAESKYKEMLSNIEDSRRKTLLLTGGQGLVGKDLEIYNSSRIKAEEIYVNTTINLRKEAANELKKIQSESTEAFLSDLEKEEKEINDKYDNWIKRAGDAGADSNYIISLITSKLGELSNVSNNTAFKMSEYYRKVFGDLSDYGYRTITELIRQTEEISRAKEKNIDGRTFMVWDTEALDKEGNAIKRTNAITIEEYNKLLEKLKELRDIAEKMNPIEAVSKSFKALSTAIKDNDIDGIENAVKKVNDSLISSKQYVENLISSFEGLGETPKQVLNAALNISTGVVGMISGIKMAAQAGAAAILTIEGASVILGVITAAIQVISTIINPIIKGAKEFREAEKKFLQDNIKLQLEYNAALNEQILLQKDSSIFIDDYAKKILDASRALIDAQKYFNEIIYPDRSDLSNLLSNMDFELNKELNSYDALFRFLSGLQVKIGVEKKKFLGITTGSRDIFGSLLEEYPELIDKSGKFNSEIAQTILALDGIPDKTKNALEALIKWEEKMSAANDSIDSAIESIAGFLSSDLFNALRTAWDDSTDSFLAFKESVSKGLKDIVSQMVFNAVFAESFKKLQENLRASFGIGGDADVTDDIAILLSSAPQLLAAWEKAMQDSESAARAAGFDWGKTSSGSGGLVGQIRRELTEDTGTELAAIFRSTRDDGRKALTQGRAQITHLINIERNTQETVYRLDRAIIELIDINKNTKGAYAGAL